MRIRVWNKRSACVCESADENRVKDFLLGHLGQRFKVSVGVSYVQHYMVGRGGRLLDDWDWFMERIREFEGGHDGVSNGS